MKVTQKYTVLPAKKKKNFTHQKNGLCSFLFLFFFPFLVSRFGIRVMKKNFLHTSSFFYTLIKLTLATQWSLSNLLLQYGLYIIYI